MANTGGVEWRRKTLLQAWIALILENPWQEARVGGICVYPDFLRQEERLGRALAQQTPCAVPGLGEALRAHKLLPEHTKPINCLMG